MLSGENGILKKAAEAKVNTEEGKEKETTTLESYEYLLKKNTGERCWQYKTDSKGRKTIITDGTVELPIGTYINYDSTKDENGNSIKKETVSKENGYGSQSFSNTVDN